MTLNLITFFRLLGLLVVTSAAGAGADGVSGSADNICEQPLFSQFAPADRPKIAAGSEFSFIASKITRPDSIKATVMDQAVSVKVNPFRQDYLVKGNLPLSLRGTFARINIKAIGLNGCIGSGVWLVDIAE